MQRQRTGFLFSLVTVVALLGKTRADSELCTRPHPQISDDAKIEVYVDKHPALDLTSVTDMKDTLLEFNVTGNFRSSKQQNGTYQCYKNGKHIEDSGTRGLTCIGNNVMVTLLQNGDHAGNYTCVLIVGTQQLTATVILTDETIIQHLEVSLYDSVKLECGRRSDGIYWERKNKPTAPLEPCLSIDTCYLYTIGKVERGDEDTYLCYDSTSLNKKPINEVHVFVKGDKPSSTGAISDIVTGITAIPTPSSTSRARIDVVGAGIGGSSFILVVVIGTFILLWKKRRCKKRQSEEDTTQHYVAMNKAAQKEDTFGEAGKSTGQAEGAADQMKNVSENVENVKMEVKVVSEKVENGMKCLAGQVQKVVERVECVDSKITDCAKRENEIMEMVQDNAVNRVFTEPATYDGRRATY